MNIHLLTVNSTREFAINPATTWDACVLVLGVLDGVHKGHQFLLERAKELAKKNNLPLVVSTFDPHPPLVTGKTFSGLITDLHERIALISYYANPEAVVIFRFNRTFADVSPEEFISRVIASMLKPAIIVVGTNYRFGKDRRGTPELLKKLLPDINIITVDLVSTEKHPISSSLIRQLVLNSEIDKANSLLGHPYIVTGITAKGAGRGTKLGFPTINGVPFSKHKLLPPDGVYAGVVSLDGTGLKPAAVYIGTAPTFGESRRRIEMHLIDTYEIPTNINVFCLFVEHFLRPEKKFPSPDALRQAIHSDINQIKELLTMQPARTSLLLRIATLSMKFLQEPAIQN